MFNLVYTSVARPGFDAAQLAAVLDHSRVNNRKLGITGVLLVRGRRIIQALEGEEAAVRKLAATLRQDHRHVEFTVVSEGFSEQRQFPDWAMGFRELTCERSTQSQTLVDRLMAGHFTSAEAMDGPKLLRAIFRAFAVDDDVDLTSRDSADTEGPRSSRTTPSSAHS